MFTQLQLSDITNKQLTLLRYLYKFPYLNTNQFQKLFKHSNPRTIQEWLKNLTLKKYIIPHDFNRNKFIANTKPAIYSLSLLARKRLKQEKKLDINVLNRIYQEKKLSYKSIDQTIFLADIYLNILSQIEGGEKLHFSTKANLRGYDYFPTPLPDAYIALSCPNKKTKRYFLFLLTIYIPWKILRSKIEKLVEYSENNRWSEISNDPLPLFLFVCLNEQSKRQINKIISNNLPRASFYLSTKTKIQSAGFKGDVWEKVE